MVYVKHLVLCLSHNECSSILAVIKDIIRKSKHFISPSKQSEAHFLFAPEISNVILMLGIQKPAFVLGKYLFIMGGPLIHVG